MSDKPTTNLPAKPIKASGIVWNDHNIESFHSAVLANDSKASYQYSVNWWPDYFLVVARLTAGFIFVYPSMDRSALYFRLQNGELVVPLKVQGISIETVGATGFYDVYPVRNLKEFRITS